MTWTKIDDHFFDRPNIAPLSPLAQLLHLKAQVYSNGVESDGYVPDAVASSRLDAACGVRFDDLAGELLREGLWARSDRGWIVDMTDQLSADELASRQRVRTEAGRRGGVASGRARRRRTLSVVSGNEANEASASSKTNPVPSRPETSESFESIDIAIARRGVTLDEAAFAEINGRYRAVGRWWIARHAEQHRVAAINEDTLLGIAMDVDLPLDRIIETMERLWRSARGPVRTLDYFWGELQRVEHEDRKDAEPRQRKPRGAVSLGQLLGERAL